MNEVASCVVTQAPPAIESLVNSLNNRSDEIYAVLDNIHAYLDHIRCRPEVKLSEPMPVAPQGTIEQELLKVNDKQDNIHAVAQYALDRLRELV